MKPESNPCSRPDNHPDKKKHLNPASMKPQGEDS